MLFEVGGAMAKLKAFVTGSLPSARQERPTRASTEHGGVSVFPEVTYSSQLRYMRVAEALQPFCKVSATAAAGKLAMLSSCR